MATAVEFLLYTEKSLPHNCFGAGFQNVRSRNAKYYAYKVVEEIVQ